MDRSNYSPSVSSSLAITSSETSPEPSLDSYEVLICDDPRIIAVLLPDGGGARRLVRNQGQGWLAHRILGGRHNKLEVVSQAGKHHNNSSAPRTVQKARLTEPVLALRLVDTYYSVGSGNGCDLTVPHSNLRTVAFDIHLSSKEPSVSIKCHDQRVFLNETSVGHSDFIEISKETPIQIDDIVLRLIPIKTLLSKRAARNVRHAAGDSMNKKGVSISNTGAELELQNYKPDSLKDFERQDDGKLGEGGQGRVYKYDCPKSGRTLAVKVMRYLNANDPKAPRRKYYLEREVLMSPKIAEHDYLLRVLDIFEYSEGFAITMPLLREGSLTKVIHEMGRLSMNTVKIVISQVLKALQCLHGQSILHRDIKPSNILVLQRDPMTTKTADYGCVSEFVTSPHSFVGTPAFIAPEVYNATPERPYDGKVDVYSLGMTLLDLLDVRLPRDTPRSHAAWNREIGRVIKENLKPVYASDHRKAFEAAQKMGAHLAKDRPTVAECFQLPWFVEVDQTPHYHATNVPSVGTSRPQAFTPAPADLLQGPMGSGPRPVVAPPGVPMLPHRSTGEESSEELTVILPPQGAAPPFTAEALDDDAETPPPRKKRKLSDGRAQATE